MKARRLLEMLGFDMGNMRRSILEATAKADLKQSCKHYGARIEATHNERRLLLAISSGRTSTTAIDRIPTARFKGRGLKMEWNHFRRPARSGNSGKGDARNQNEEIL